MKSLLLTIIIILNVASCKLTSDCNTTVKDETNTYYDDESDEELKERYTYKQTICSKSDTTNVLHGFFELSDIENNPIKSFVFKDGKLFGESIVYHSNGNVQMIANFENDN